MGEPKIQIDDFVLSEAQAMALRVAATAFHAEMCEPEAQTDLGPIALAYRDRLHEILKVWLSL